MEFYQDLLDRAEALTEELLPLIETKPEFTSPAGKRVFSIAAELLALTLEERKRREQDGSMTPDREILLAFLEMKYSRHVAIGRHVGALPKAS